MRILLIKSEDEIVQDQSKYSQTVNIQSNNVISSIRGRTNDEVHITMEAKNYPYDNGMYDWKELTKIIHLTLVTSSKLNNVKLESLIKYIH